MVIVAPHPGLSEAGDSAFGSQVGAHRQVSARHPSLLRPTNAVANHSPSLTAGQKANSWEQEVGFLDQGPPSPPGPKPSLRRAENRRVQPDTKNTQASTVALSKLVSYSKQLVANSQTLPLELAAGDLPEWRSR